MTFRTILFAVVFGAVASVAGAGPTDAPAEIVTFSAHDAAAGNNSICLPLLQRVRYDVEVYGGTAVGTLRHELRNDTEEDLTVRVEHFVKAPIEITALDLERDRRPIALAYERKEAPASTAASATPSSRVRPESLSPEQRAVFVKTLRDVSDLRTRERRPPPAPSKLELVTDSFDLPAGETAWLRTGFRRTLEFDDRRFRLTLPGVRELGARRRGDLPLEISVTIHQATRLQSTWSDTHDILADFVGDRTIVETVRPEVPAKEPFRMQFIVHGERDTALVSYVHRETDGLRAIEAVLDPPEQPVLGTIRPKQMLFVIDTSGSMKQQDKLEQARRAVSSCLQKLRPEDRFNIVEFDSDFSLMSPAPVDLTEFGKDAAERWLAALAAGGGTTLLPALEETLRQPTTPDRHRIVIVVTDGILNDERPVLQMLEEKLGETRLFVVGTGPRMRQETLLRLAEYGRGAAAFAGRADALEGAVADLFDSISDPLGWDLQFDWGLARVEEITPQRLPDLYAGRPVKVLAWVRGDLPASLGLRMSTMEGEQRLQVRLPRLSP